MAEPRTIAVNRKARHDYFIEETYEAGLSLQGWEVKSLRAGRVNLAIGVTILVLVSMSVEASMRPVRPPAGYPPAGYPPGL